MKFLIILVIFVGFQARANEVAPFLGAYRAVGACEFSGPKSRLYVSLEAGGQSLLLRLFGDDATQMGISLGSGSQKSDNGLEKYATQIAGGTLTSTVQFFLGNQMTGSEKVEMKFITPKRLVLTSRSSYLPNLESCVFEKK